MTGRQTLHPLYHEAVSAAHARPALEVPVPGRVSSAVFVTGEQPSGQQARSILEQAAATHGLTIISQNDNEVILGHGAARVKWEQHTEFASLTAVQGGGDEASPDLLGLLLDAGAFAGELISRTVFIVEPAGTRSAPDLREGTDLPIRVRLNGGAQSLYADLRHDERGWITYHLEAIDHAPQRLGRLIQRLLEIESYRLLAYLAMPLVRQIGPQIGRLDRQINDIAQRASANPDADEEAAILEELTSLSAGLQHLGSTAEFRFSASLAYAAIVNERLRELREERIEGFQRLSTAIRRRLEPNMRSCQALQARIDRGARRISNISELLRTRVDLQLQTQNASLLKSIDSRAQAQLQLQETVEGLSVAAISYYCIGLLAYFLKGLEHMTGKEFQFEALVFAIPVIIILILLMVRRIRRHSKAATT
jgi:uncharacterized membrane-anchored protein